MSSTTTTEDERKVLREHINGVYNKEIRRAANHHNRHKNEDYFIREFGEIWFAENDRPSKYIRAPFTAKDDDGTGSSKRKLPQQDSIDQSEGSRQSIRSLPSPTTDNHREPNAEAKRIVKLMFDGWKLPTPQLLISVTGGADHFDLENNPRLQHAFQRGLIAAAVTTDAWIITGGTHAGVMKEVGNAVDKCRYKNTKTPSKVQCIGIASWYYTTDHDQLVHHHSLPYQSSSQTTIPMNSYLSNLPLHADPRIRTDKTSYEEQTNVYQSRVNKTDRNSCALDLNHTHFILLDDMLGENRENDSPKIIKKVNCRADLTIELRAEIEHEIHKSYDIPIVQILANGGASSILTVCQALRQGTPVIVIEGTGRAADKIAEDYKSLYGDRSLDHKEERPRKIYDEAEKEFDAFKAGIKPLSSTDENSINNRTNYEQFIEQLTSYEGYMLITIFHFRNEHGEQKLDPVRTCRPAVLQNKTKQNKEQKLDDAILHALVNAARLTEDGGNQPFDELKLAMAWNKFERAQQIVLTEQTVDKQDSKLGRALANAIIMDKVRFASLLVEYGASFDKLSEVISRANLYQNAIVTFPILSKEFTPYEKYFNRNKSGNPSDNDNPTKLSDKINYQDLYFSSIFVDRFKMATYLCSKSSDTIVAALIASKLYQEAAEGTNEREKGLEYVRKEKEFAKHASNIIDMCYDESKQFALRILKRKSSLFFDKSPLDLAEQLNSRPFLATKTVQHHLDQKWFGHNQERGRDDFWISVLILFLCLCPPLIAIPAISDVLTSRQKQSTAWEKRSPIIEWIIGIFHRFKNFYRGRAIVRYYYNIMFYMLFLTLFSFVLLVDYFPLNTNGGVRNDYKGILMPVTEVFLHILMWSLIIEEATEFFRFWHEERKNDSRSIVKKYFVEDQWNILDIIAISFYLIGFALRFIVNEAAFKYSKIFMCLTFFLWCIRLLHIFAAYERFGPKLLMIFNTMKDLLFFIYFVLIFLVGYSVSSYALLTTKQQVFWNKTAEEGQTRREYSLSNNGTALWNWNILRNVAGWGIWKVYGEVELETEYHLSDNSTIEVANDTYGTVVFILTVIFICIANVLLLNVLVALFNVTIQNVERDAHASWAYHRFRLVTEYSKKFPLPPPLNVIAYICFPMYRYIKKKLKIKQMYGIHDGEDIIILNSNLHDMVVFNHKDCIERAGVIRSITIHFVNPPSDANPPIRLYLLSTNGNRFSAGNGIAVPNVNNGEAGPQSISFKERISCEKGQFVALAFPSGSNRPVCARDRDQYSITLKDFYKAQQKTNSIEFRQYPNKGVAFSFMVDESTHRNQVMDMSLTIRISDRTINKRIESNQPSFKRQLPNKTESPPNMTKIKQNKFQERDDMLRESSIAEDYWREVIDAIKEQEAKQTDEQSSLSNNQSGEGGQETFTDHNGNHDNYSRTIL